MDKIITKREITAMVYDDLLAFVHKHAHMLGNQYPKHMEDFYCPRILDKPHLLRKLCQQDLDLFTQMVREMNLKEYIEGGKWAAVLLSQGGTLPEEVLRQQESVMSAKSFTTSGLRKVIFLFCLYCSWRSVRRRVSFGAPNIAKQHMASLPKS